MFDLLAYGFMQRALAASIVVGLVCSIIGVFVTLRGLSFIGAGTAHAAFAGVTLAYLVGLPPFPLAVSFSLATAWITGFLERAGKMKLDVSVGIFYTTTMAMAVLFLGMMQEYNPEVYGYLFGSILSVTQEDLIVIVILSIVILALLWAFFKEFHFITFDPEMAEASGIPGRRLFFLLLTLISLTIVLALKAVGAILVFALIVIPPAAAHQFAFSMRGMLLRSALFGVGSAVAGVFLSYLFDLPSGATIVLIAAALFFLSVLVSPKRQTWGRVEGHGG